MSKITSDELGRRRFQVLRDKAAEQALEKIRKALGEKGQGLSPEESSMVREVLKEIWSGVDQTHWESFCFARVSHEDIQTILGIAGKGKDVTGTLPAMAETMRKILLEKL